MLLFLLVTLPAFAAGPDRKPWQWTVEERLARRFDPAGMRARRAADEAEHPRAAATANAPETVTEGVDGRRNPELFLPHELFEGLVTVYTAEEPIRTKQRELFGAGLRRFGYDDQEFWARLEPIVAKYVALRKAQGDSTEQCRERYAALQAARNAFGSFDMMLYTVIAPLSATSTTVDARVDPAQRLRAAHEGCR